jgi:hypothetical protein
MRSGSGGTLPATDFSDNQKILSSGKKFGNLEPRTIFA